VLFGRFVVFVSSFLRVCWMVVSVVRSEDASVLFCAFFWSVFICEVSAWIWLCVERFGV
jgi:hypothetical protein